MSLGVACVEQKAVDRHFSGDLAPSDERRMREHLPGCETCRRHYERHMMLASFDPAALGPSARIGRGLGLGLGSWRGRGWAGAGLVAAAAIVLVSTAIVRKGDGEQAFQSRGTVANVDTRVLVYEAKDGETPKLVGAAVQLATMQRIIQDTARFPRLLLDLLARLERLEDDGCDSSIYKTNIDELLVRLLSRGA